ncbi:VTT domain-containing protein [Dechloromonas sp. XY25]|uniref:VTT domain-containing protein n=1 Tax=Dechloromonas hankyongensis TaxID=2908002 RepID=A0ABS9JZ50_9RHOO|nr:VTT domain-containing protein [Dechloromonas hankyongensis]MCG2576192.1 VTT domain-containing protein [Dechloromonas hankyongensis]
MDIAQITQTLRQDAVTVVFFNVLLQQLGLPVPAVPTLLLAGSLAATSGSLGQVLAAAVVASVLADWLWYWSGKVFGYRVLAGLCKLSINPSSCVSQTEARFIRWGISSLVVAKFIPGFSTVAPPIAGALRMSQTGFLLAAGVGAALWAGAAIGVGWLLQDAVQSAIAVLDRHMARALVVLLVVLAVWLGWKLWQKYRFRKFCAVPHVTPAELIAALDSDTPPLVLDLRGATMIAETGPIAGARVAEHDFLHEAVGDWPKDRPIVTLCACPEDAGAVQAARHLLNAGYLSVKPLKGGYEAWLASQPTAAPERSLA